MRTGESTKTGFILGMLVLLFLLLRLSFLLTRPNVAHPEESLLGILVKHILESKVQGSVFDYFSPHEGGIVISTLVAAGICKVSGLSTAALRGISLFHGMLMLGMFFFFVNAFFKRPVAITASLFYILAPPSFTHYTYLFFVNEYFVIFFDILILFCFFKIFFVPGNRRNAALFSCLGFVSGLSVFYLFSSLLFVVSVLLFWYMFDRMFFRRKEFMLFFVFFTAGISPFFYYAVSHWQIMQHDPAANPLHYLRLESLPDLVQKTGMFPGFFMRNLIGSFQFEFFTGRLAGAAENIAYSGILLIAMLYCACGGSRDLAKICRSLIPGRRYDLEPAEIRPESLLLAVPFVFFIFCFFSNYCTVGTVQARYFFPLYPLFFIFLSLFFVRLLSARKALPVCAALTAAGLVGGMCLYANVRFIGTQDPWAAYDLAGLLGRLKAKGIRYVYSTYFYKWQIAFESREDIIVSCAGIRYFYYPGIPELIDWEKYGERFGDYEKKVDEAVRRGERYAYVFDASSRLPYAAILETYLGEHGIRYAREQVNNDFTVYFDIDGKVRSSDVDFTGKWE